MAFFTLMALSFTGLEAQFMIGPKAGVGASMYHTKSWLRNESSSKIKLGYSGGIKARLPLFSGIELIPELNYSFKSGRIVSSDPVETYPLDVYAHRTIQTGHIDLPLLVAYKFRGKEFAPFVFLGPTLSFAIHGKTKLEFKDKDKVDLSRSQLEDADLVNLYESLKIGSKSTDEVSGYDVTLTVGGGFYYELDLGRLVVDIRYDHGAKNVFNQKSDDWDSEIMKRRNLYLSIGYLFSFSEF